MTQNNKSISPLRQRMIEDMHLRKLAPGTQTAYIRGVKKFTIERKDVARWMALPRSESGQSALDSPAQPRLSCRGAN
ncbi:MAG: hypothetical protein BMS9Abin01_0306 [Gammaproteobacteria bacterium]|nr:MAG: hypothetical protein BMS9Abin01_0306 [Gammaproteobacteria bacterium]